MSSTAYEAFFGGAAGPGKTDCLIMEALRQIHHPRYNAVIFRRTYPMLEGADGIIARTKHWYPAFGGTYNETKHAWTFPSGAKVFLAHLNAEDDVYIYQGWQIQYIAFDELTQFTEFQYLYLMSRNRADADLGLRCYVRSGANPGGVGHEWVKRRFIRSGVKDVIGYFARVNGKDTRVAPDHPDARSRIFIPALFDTNPKLTREYLSNLRQLDPISRAQLEAGDWDAENRDSKIYPDWGNDNITAEADYDPRYPVYWGVDDGYTNPRAILLIQERPCQGKPDRVCVFAEYQHSQELAETSIRHTLALGYPVPELVYYDPSGVEFAANCTALGLSTWGAYNDIGQGVKVVRRFICDGNQERRLLVHPRCEKLIEAFPTYVKDEKKTAEKGGDPVPLKNGFEHPLDALRYFIATRYLYE